MADKNIALAILGIIVVIAIVGLVFLFSSARTGAGIYANYDYSMGQIATRFPYARQTGEMKVTEYPATTVSGLPPGARQYGGGPQFFMTGTEKGVRSTLGPLYTTYKRSGETDVPASAWTGIGIEFADGIILSQCYGDRIYYAKSSKADIICSTVDMYGRNVNDLLPQYIGCCNG